MFQRSKHDVQMEPHSQNRHPADPYRYRSLQTPSTIRLLKILPKPKNGKIACTLKHFPDNAFQDDAIPPYHALSYVWGDPKKTREILLKDADAESWHKHDLHENLWELLDQMHTLSSHQTELYFWTDFLCLDQGSTVEMNQQVQRMGHIYSGAVRTIAWLGRPSSTSSRDLQSLQDELDWIPDWLTRERQNAEELPPFIRPPASRWNFTNSGAWNPAFWSIDKGFKSTPDLKSGNVLPPLGRWFLPFHKILRLPYWQRVWIVQEVALSKKVDLMVGAKSIDIEDFLLAYKVHMHHMSRGSHAEEELIAAAAARTTPRGELSIFRILEWAELCKSKRPLDRVYGLLGLMEAHESGGPPTLEVNYNKEAVEVLWDVVLACCRSSPLIPGTIGTIINRFPELLQCSNTLETFEAYARNERTSNINRATALEALELFPTFRALSPLNGTHIYVAPSDLLPSSWKLPTTEAGSEHVFYHPRQAVYGSFLRLMVMFLLRGNKPVPAQSIQAAVIAALLALQCTDQGQWICRAHLSTNEATSSENKTHGIHFKVLRSSFGFGRISGPFPPDMRQVPPICSRAGGVGCDSSLLVLHSEKLGCSLTFSPSEEKADFGDLHIDLNSS